MTPWNLVGMARVKGLDVIALTDHNTARNTPEAMAAGEAYGVQVIPGMEITSREEVHILGYFSSVPEALAAGEAVYAHLPQVQNQPALFGNQIIIGADDSPSGTLESCSLTPRTSAWKRSVRLSAPLGACLCLRISTAAATA